MLTLTRREGERIAIGDEVEITVVDIGRGKVRIGIRAPRHLAILRSEVLDRIVEENQRAATQLAPEVPHEPDGVIDVPSGLPGLREHKRFVLAEVPGYAAMRALVSLSDELVRLLIVDAQLIDPEYPVQQARTGAGFGEEEVAVALVITLPRDGRPPTVNMLAPIVIGLASRRAEQVILDGSGLSPRHELAVAPEEPSVVQPAAP